MATSAKSPSNTARIRTLKFAAGNTIGFHPVLDDTDATDREIQITWTGREAHDQSLGFGYLILSAEPAIAKELARGPSPANKAADVPVDAALSWAPGQFAASHDVYFGTVFADVNNATRSKPHGRAGQPGPGGDGIRSGELSPTARPTTGGSMK